MFTFAVPVMSPAPQFLPQQRHLWRLISFCFQQPSSKASSLAPAAGMETSLVWSGYICSVCGGTVQPTYVRTTIQRRAKVQNSPAMVMTIFLICLIWLSDSTTSPPASNSSRSLLPSVVAVRFRRRRNALRHPGQERGGAESRDKVRYRTNHSRRRPLRLA